MTIPRTLLLSIAAFLTMLPSVAHGQTFSDVTSKTYEYTNINQVIKNGWMSPLTASTFGYGVNITPNDWLYMLMFLRTSDACPEYGTTPNQYWLPENIRACLSGAGIPMIDASLTTIRRDEAMQQLFALRRRSFAFEALQTKPAGYAEPLDLKKAPANRQGAMIAADRLKLLFRTKNNILPTHAFLREDAALAVSRFIAWERQGGTDGETNDQLTISKEAKLNHWKDLDTDIYVLEMKSGGDTYIHPILPRRSFNPAKTTTTTVRDEFVYQPVSDLAKESGALAAINGSYFNVQWPWGALEDVAIVNSKTYLSRTDRSTFVVCADGKMYIGLNNTKSLQAANCKPEHALGAGPLFLSSGEILTQSTKEGFDEYTQWERRVGKNARTAVGISKDRKTAYLIVVAGKSYPAFGRGGSSLGTFLKDKYPNIQDAMMYDGGGSTALYAHNNLLVGSGVSGDQTERSVISALGIFSKKAEKTALAAFKKEQLKRWDHGNVAMKTERPTKTFPWQDIKQAKGNGIVLATSGSRGSQVSIVDAKDNTHDFNLIFDLISYSTTTKLTITRREGTHEFGWKVPTEIRVFDPKDKSDTDIIKLFSYIPEAQRPDLKTFDAISFGKTGIIFGDASGRTWFYYARDKQLSPASFLKKVTKPAAKTTVKK